MYKCLRKLLDVAENIAGIEDNSFPVGPGKINDMDMREWIPGKNRIQINGKTKEGKDFELTLEVSECQKSE